MARITEDEWLTELAKLSIRNDEGMTVEEWCSKLGKSRGVMRKLLHEAKAKGWLVVGKQSREAIDGRMMASNVYRIIRPKK